MNLIVQKVLNENIKYKEYLRENSYWYKYLNRDYKNIEKMINEIKKIDRERKTNKINNIIDTFDIIGAFMDETN